MSSSGRRFVISRTAKFSVLEFQATPFVVDVLVVGAGCAGLAAASKLYSEHSKSVLVLEAQNYAGGRVCTSTMDGNRIEMGAQWCHGTYGNAAFDIAQRAGLFQEDETEDDEESYSNGGFRRADGSMPSPRAIALFMGTRAEKISEAEHYSRASSESIPESTSLLEFLDENRSPEDEGDLFFSVTQWRDMLQCNIDGCHSLADVSLKHYASYDELPGPDVRVNKGYQGVPLSLMQQLPAGSVRFSSRVVKIVQGEGCVEVVCSDGRKYFARKVVVTVSIGVLKAEAPGLFEPALPAEKLQAIDRIGFGTVDKVFVHTSPSFWERNEGGFNVLWDRNDNKGDDGDLWCRGIWRLERIGTCSLMCWVNGDAALDMETLDELELGLGCLNLVHRFAPRARAPTEDDVVSVQRSTWGTNPLFHGSYSYVAVNSSVADIALLAQPVGNTVFFAGEATSPEHYSTVHGAIESGYRVAEEIANTRFI